MTVSAVALNEMCVTMDSPKRFVREKQAPSTSANANSPGNSASCKCTAANQNEASNTEIRAPYATPKLCWMNPRYTISSTSGAQITTMTTSSTIHAPCAASNRSFARFSTASLLNSEGNNHWNGRVTRTTNSN